MKSAYPYFKHFAHDHLNDKELARCSPEAEGLFWRSVSVSHFGEPYGYLTDSHGKPYEWEDICELKAAAIMRGRTTVEKLAAAWKELLDEKRVLFDRDRKAWYVPKMVKIEAANAYYRKMGRTGGNPTLKERAEARLREQHNHDQAVKDILRVLWNHRDDKAEFAEQMRVANNKHGKAIVDEALDLVKMRQGKLLPPCGQNKEEPR